jgi:hypothetical protein
MTDSFYMTSSTATSSGFSDDNNTLGMDEDVLFYLSTLSPDQQRMLEDFVSINDHTAIVQPQQPPSNVVKFAYGNSVGANHYLGRPVSMYEPKMQNEFSSLPPDLVSSNAAYSEPDVDIGKLSYEAEDAEYIETLNEMRDNFEYQSVETDYNCAHQKVTFTADIHYDESGSVEAEYATVQKPKKHQSQMIASSESASDNQPCQKYPKIMTQSCYGQLNELSLYNTCYEQDLVQSMENIIEDGNHQAVVSSLMTSTTTTDSSLIDGVFSINSSIYDQQIPSSMTSSISTSDALGSNARHSSRKIVKWWDDHHDESLQDLHETAEEGE